jgi:hypothetical protein
VQLSQVGRINMLNRNKKNSLGDATGMYYSVDGGRKKVEGVALQELPIQKNGTYLKFSLNDP